MYYVSITYGRNTDSKVHTTRSSSMLIKVRILTWLLYKHICVLAWFFLKLQVHIQTCIIWISILYTKSRTKKICAKLQDYCKKGNSKYFSGSTIPFFFKFSDHKPLNFQYFGSKFLPALFWLRFFRKNFLIPVIALRMTLSFSERE